MKTELIVIDSGNIKKIAGVSILSICGALIALNSFTIVSAGTAKVQTTFGTVNDSYFGEGIHFPVNPLSGV